MIFNFLRLQRSILFLKRIQIGLTLLKNSFKIIFFQHHKYFIFCAFLTLIQISRLTVSTYIDPNITISTLIKEFLGGENFFEITWKYLKFPISCTALTNIIIKTFLFFLEILMTLLISSAAANYTLMKFNKQNLSIKKSFLLSFKKWKIFGIWGCFELFILFISSLMGTFGNLLYFFWQLVVVMKIQIISFENVSAFRALQKSLNFFKRYFSNIIGPDIFTDLTVLILSMILYYFYLDNVALNFGFSFSNENLLFFIIILYLISILIMIEIITFTALYKLRTKKH